MIIPNLTLTEVKKMNKDEYYEMLEASFLIEEEQQKQIKKNKK